MGNVYKKSLISVWKPSDADANGMKRFYIRHTEYKQYIEPRRKRPIQENGIFIQNR